MKKKVTRVESTAVTVLPRHEAVRDVDMLDMIRDDMSKAQIGAFSSLRAGIGLLCMKEMGGHGSWETRMVEEFPNRAPRTLRNYMENARMFCAMYSVTPQIAWGGFRDISTEQLDSLVISPPSEVRKLTGGKPSGGITRMLADYFAQKTDAKKKKAAEPSKPLTEKEKIEAATDNANRIANLVADWISDMMWSLVDKDTLDNIASGLRAASDKLRQELKSRAKLPF